MNPLSRDPVGESGKSQKREIRARDERIGRGVPSVRTERETELEPSGKPTRLLSHTSTLAPQFPIA